MTENAIDEAIEWLKNSLSEIENVSFLETHIVGVFEEKDVLTFREILGFLDNFSDELQTVMREKKLTLAMIFELSSRERDLKVTEREIHGSGDNGSIKNIDAFTPPSLYLLRNPAHVIFFKASELSSIFEQNDWYGFTRTSTENDDYSKCFIFLKYFDS